MMSSEKKTSLKDITTLLQDWSDGDSGALEKLTPLVFQELQRLAEFQLARERPGHTLQPTALVHEFFLRIYEDPPAHLYNRAHFYKVAARVMRRVLVDYARKHNAFKRGGVGRIHLGLEEVGDPASPILFEPLDMIALDHALEELGKRDATQKQTVEPRFFAGLSPTETADVMGVNVRTVKRKWAAAKIWLARELIGE